MDISEQYIKMCQQAEEIQQAWVKTIGDYFYNPPYYANNKVSIIFDAFIRNKEEGREYFGGTYSMNERVLDGAVWLPHQDQIQDMINKKWTSVDLAWHFSEWATNATNVWGNTTPFNSMEQLWLAFVMHEKYSKCWDGIGWMEESKWILLNK